MRRRLMGVAVALLAIYLLVAAGLYVFQRSVLFVPDRSRPDVAAAAIPGLRAIELTTADGVKLLAWYLPPSDGGPTIAYFHGNGGNVINRIPRLRRFAQAGWGILIPEYRGYGGNPGQPSEAGFFADAAAAMAYLHAEGIAADRLVAYGESIGTGVAVEVATRERLAGLILESPYTSITAIARRRFFFLPVDWMLKDRFDSLSRISLVTAPVLVLQGSRDMIVPPVLGQRLFAAANEPKTFWAAPDAGHNNLMQFGAFEPIAAFVARCTESRGVAHPSD